MEMSIRSMESREKWGLGRMILGLQSSFFRHPVCNDLKSKNKTRQKDDRTIFPHTRTENSFSILEKRCFHARFIYI